MKPKMAVTWAAGCGGCDASLLDLGLELLEAADRFEIVYWPAVLDFKRERLEALDDGELHTAWINGAVRTEAQEDLVRLLRRKARFVVAQGTCAHLGGVIGLANRFTPQEFLERIRPDALEGEIPADNSQEGHVRNEGREWSLPALKSGVLPLDRIITVDFIIPGCPPPPALNARALSIILSDPPHSGSRILAGSQSLCHDCSRRETRPDPLRRVRPLRIHQTRWDPQACFLGEGLPCLGPATRGDCGSRCIRANIPCRGCFGPLDGIVDHGARVLAFLASLLEGGDPGEIEAGAKAFPDPLGLAYFYSLASSLLMGGQPEQSHDQKD